MSFEGGYTFKAEYPLRGDNLYDFVVFYLRKFLDKAGYIEDIIFETEEWLKTLEPSTTIRLDKRMDVKRVYGLMLGEKSHFKGSNN